MVVGDTEGVFKEICCLFRFKIYKRADIWFGIKFFVKHNVNYT